MPYTINDFTKEYHEKKGECDSYRIGQYFVWLFIKKSDTPEMKSLWNEWDVDVALVKIHEIIQRYNWDYYDLPVKLTRQQSACHTYKVAYDGGE
jgi:hypothetical protein